MERQKSACLCVCVRVRVCVCVCVCVNCTENTRVLQVGYGRKGAGNSPRASPGGVPPASASIDLTGDEDDEAAEGSGSATTRPEAATLQGAMSEVAGAWVRLT